MLKNRPKLWDFF